MTRGELKSRMKEIIKTSNPKEQQRLDVISNKKLNQAGINHKEITTDNDVRHAWVKYNKYEADWERYCRQQHYERTYGRYSKNYSVGDYSHLAYNGVADDF